MERGCFIIDKRTSSFSFQFKIFMHKDDAPMLKYICERLKVGNVNIGDHFVCYTVSSRNDLLKYLLYLTKHPLTHQNT